MMLFPKARSERAPNPIRTRSDRFRMRSNVLGCAPIVLRIRADRAEECAQRDFGCAPIVLRAERLLADVLGCAPIVLGCAPIVLRKLPDALRMRAERFRNCARIPKHIL